jgi:hypothetical protein
MDKLRAQIRNYAQAHAAGSIRIRAEALDRAKAGDWEPLGRYLQTSHLRRRGGVITREVRDFICGVLLGKHRRRKHRPQKDATARLKKEVVTFLIEKTSSMPDDDDGLVKLTHAVELAAAKFKKTKRTIWAYWEQREKWIGEISENVRRKLEGHPEPYRDLWYLFQEKPPRYFVSSTPKYTTTKEGLRLDMRKR